MTEVGRYQPGQKDKQGKPAFTPIPLEQRQRAYKVRACRDPCLLVFHAQLSPLCTCWQSGSGLVLLVLC